MCSRQARGWRFGNRFQLTIFDGSSVLLYPFDSDGNDPGVAHGGILPIRLPFGSDGSRVPGHCGSSLGHRFGPQRSDISTQQKVIGVDRCHRPARPQRGGVQLAERLVVSALAGCCWGNRLARRAELRVCRCGPLPRSLSRTRRSASRRLSGNLNPRVRRVKPSPVAPALVRGHSRAV